MRIAKKIVGDDDPWHNRNENETRYLNCWEIDRSLSHDIDSWMCLGNKNKNNVGLGKDDWTCVIILTKHITDSFFFLYNLFFR